MSRVLALLCALIVHSVASDNVTDVCGFDAGAGPWSNLLEDWVTTPERPGRQGRILTLQNKNYYITDRVDLVPPPPAPNTRINNGPHMNVNPGPYNYYEQPYTNAGNHQPNNPTAAYNQQNQYPQGQNYGSSYDQSAQNNQIGQYAQTPQSPSNYVQNQQNAPYTQTPPSPVASQNGGSAFVQSSQSPVEPQPSAPTPSGPKPYNEWQGPPPPSRPSGGKIVNRPPNPNKDKFKPSYEYYEKPQQPYKPTPAQKPPRPSPVDRVDDPPKKQVSETDLFLLSAIEKLVYRVDLMEKRLRRVEESMHYIVVGHDPQPDPCVSNFTRVSGVCYHFSQEAVDWKSASVACRRMKSHLLEIDTEGERRQLFSWLLAEKKNRGVNWWTGGLNPGLLWIWSHSAAAIQRNSSTTSERDPPAVSIGGDGRCLALVHDSGANGLLYRGEECGYRHRFICEKEEDKTKLGNEIQRVSRQLHITAEKIVDSRRRAKIMWDDDS